MGTVATVASSWLDRIEASRQGLIEAAKSGNRVLAAFAQADARAELIASLRDEQIQARLLKITDPDLAMVELANNPTEQDRVRICAIAILSGFVPGDDQFAIFGGGRDRSGNAKPGKLYTKEAGYRTLFGHLGIVPEVQVGFPEFVALGTSGKKVWRISGSAYCNYGDKCYTVGKLESQNGGVDNRMSLPGYESDNVAGIAAKARRRLLQELWGTLSPILNEPQADDEPETVDQPPLPQVGHTAVQAKQQELTDRERQAEGFAQTHESIQRRVKDQTQLDKITDAWKAIGDCKDKETLREMYTAVSGMVEEISKRNVDELHRWCKFCAEGLENA